MEKVIKFWLFLIFLPALLILSIRALLVLLIILLPVIILHALVMGAAAGIGAGMVLRRRLPPRNGGRFLPPRYPRNIPDRYRW